MAAGEYVQLDAINQFRDTCIAAPVAACSEWMRIGSCRSVVTRWQFL